MPVYHEKSLFRRVIRGCQRDEDLPQSFDGDSLLHPLLLRGSKLPAIVILEGNRKPLLLHAFSLEDNERNKPLAHSRYTLQEGGSRSRIVVFLTNRAIVCVAESEGILRSTPNHAGPCHCDVTGMTAT